MLVRVCSSKESVRSSNKKSFLTAHSHRNVAKRARQSLRYSDLFTSCRFRKFALPALPMLKNYLDLNSCTLSQVTKTAPSCLISGKMIKIGLPICHVRKAKNYSGLFLFTSTIQRK